MVSSPQVTAKRRKHRNESMASMQLVVARDEIHNRIEHKNIVYNKIYEQNLI